MLLQPTAYSLLAYSYLLAFTFIVAAVLIALATYDIRSGIIPDGMSLTLVVLGLLRVGYLYYSGEVIRTQVLSALGIGLFFFLL